jgi:hypothetical protein
MPPTTPPTVSNTVAPALIAPSDAPTLKMSNGFASRATATPASIKWFRHVKRIDNDRRARQNMDAMLSSKAQLHDKVRPPAEPPPLNIQRDSVMTGFTNPDHEFTQRCSNLTSNA